MNKAPGKSQFWRVFGPFLGYYGISMVVQAIIGCILVIFNAEAFAEIIIKSSPDAGTVYTETMLETLEIVGKYSVEISAVTALCTIPMTAFLYRKDRKNEQINNIPVNKKAPVLKYGLIPVLGFAVCLGFNCLIIMTNLAFVSESYQSISNMLYAASFPMQIICLGIIGPVAEELLFRGVIFKRFREHANFKIAAICTSMVFATIHGSVLQMIYTFVLGMLLAYLCEKYGSIKAPILLHICVNLVSLICTEMQILDLLYAIPKIMAFSIVVCAFVGALMFIQIQKIDEKPIVEPKGDSIL